MAELPIGYIFGIENSIRSEGKMAFMEKTGQELDKLRNYIYASGVTQAKFMAAWKKAKEDAER